MDVMLGRSQFLSETTNLFTDEKTANARAKVVEWINELSTVDAHGKISLIVKIQETIVSACIELLEEFLEFLLALSHDANMDVRKQIVVFIEQVCKVKIELLPQVVGVVSMLLRDRSPQVIKRLIQACGIIYKNGLQWLSGLKQITDSADQAWTVLCMIKAQILDLIDNENDGIRTNAIKFLEGVIVLHSYQDEDTQKKDNDFSLENVPENMRLIKRKKLEEEAYNIFDILLKFHAATHISSVNLITCNGSLCTIAKLRPSFMGPVVDAFKQLESNLPPTLTDSQVCSVRKSLKMQLLTLLKNRGSYEYQTTIRNLLANLGTSQNEILRAIPKMDKQEQIRRQKRILENAATNISKRIRMNDGKFKEIETVNEKYEIDEEELEKQRQKSTKVNEKFIAENLRNIRVVVDIIIEYLPQLPDEVTPEFINEYQPIRDMSIQQQVTKISKLLAEQMTLQKCGPGAAAFTKEIPMRKVRVLDEIQHIKTPQEEEQLRKEEATKKLRENMERVKGEQELIERMKQRAKALKLAEVTKPFSKQTMEQYMLDAVKRMLNAERACIVSGLAARRCRILTVFAATLPVHVREYIFDFIMSDIKKSIDLAFTWLYEEFCLLQGYTRHTYTKTENSPDYAYNELLTRLINGICEKCEYKDKLFLLRRVYLEAPLLTEDANKTLKDLCIDEEYSNHCLEILRDLIVYKPPRKGIYLRILLQFSLHERQHIRVRALGYVVDLYRQLKALSKRIEEFAFQWSSSLEKTIPPTEFFTKQLGRPDIETAWKEETAKICLAVLLGILPYNGELILTHLCKVFVVAMPDLKRTILRSIDTPIKVLGPQNPAILKLLDECPKGTDTLIIRLVYIITERTPVIPNDLMQRIREIYVNKIKDSRIMVPILHGLTKTEIINVLPKLIKLNPVVVKETFNRLLRIGTDFSNYTVAATPTDVLIALHTINANDNDLKFVVKATSLCFGEKEVYTQDVLIGVLQQLVEIVPIPKLLMRTIIISLTTYPRLSNFVLNLLHRLILKQVWREKVIWDGFLKCIQRLKPQSLPVLLQLPLQQLAAALQQCPDLREPLLEYAESMQHEPMSGITAQIMDIISGKAVDVFITDESGGYITADQIKKELIDETTTQEISTISTVPTLITTIPTTMPLIPPAQIKTEPGQPLPPGED